MLRVDSWSRRAGSTSFQEDAPCTDEPALVTCFCLQLLLPRDPTTLSTVNPSKSNQTMDGVRSRCVSHVVCGVLLWCLGAREFLSCGFPGTPGVFCVLGRVVWLLCFLPSVVRCKTAGGAASWRAWMAESSDIPVHFYHCAGWSASSFRACFPCVRQDTMQENVPQPDLLHNTIVCKYFRYQDGPVRTRTLCHKKNGNR